MSRITWLILISASCWITGLTAQISGGSLKGSFQTDFKYYQHDSAMGINDSTLQGRRTGSNSFLNLTYSSNNLEAGIRLESYLPAITGYDQRYTGVGMPFKYVRFYDESWDITAGNFYEQFGNGLVFRSYQDWSLGIDNSIEGIRLKNKPYKGVFLKLITGVHRYYWDRWDKDDDRNIISGGDVEIELNEVFPELGTKTQVIAGGSFITRFQKDNDPIYKVPQNVATFSGRLNVMRGPVSFLGEYAYKINDPSADNSMIYKPGEAVFMQASYAVKGFSFSIGVKRLDNMSFRSDRNAGLNDLIINYLPSLTKQHIYILPASYPYATQTLGEIGFSINTGYKLKKGTLIGGKYGTDLSASFSRISDIVRLPLDSLTPVGQPGTLGYTTDYFKSGDKFFEDFSFEIQRKINKEIKITMLYTWIFYNIAVIEGHAGEEPVISHNGVVDLTWKFSTRQALRFEVQHQETKEDKGSWVGGMIEYTNKGFFASVQDQWNYGNENKAKQLHFLMAAIGLSMDATRFSVSYGRQDEGILCVGGVCRYVPAISGFSLTFTSTF
jgi:hypothetical protein